MVVLPAPFGPDQAVDSPGLTPISQTVDCNESTELDGAELSSTASPLKRSCDWTSSCVG